MNSMVRVPPWPTSAIVACQDSYNKGSSIRANIGSTCDFFSRAVHWILVSKVLQNYAPTMDSPKITGKSSQSEGCALNQENNGLSVRMSPEENGFEIGEVKRWLHPRSWSRDALFAALSDNNRVHSSLGSGFCFCYYEYFKLALTGRHLKLIHHIAI